MGKNESTVVETPTVEVTVETKPVAKITIGGFCKNLILTTQLSNKEILSEVLKEFPQAQTTMACIAWYKSDLRNKGLIGKRVFKRAETSQEVAKA